MHHRVLLSSAPPPAAVAAEGEVLRAEVAHFRLRRRCSATASGSRSFSLLSSCALPKASSSFRMARRRGQLVLSSLLLLVIFSTVFFFSSSFFSPPCFFFLWRRRSPRFFFVSSFVECVSPNEESSFSAHANLPARTPTRSADQIPTSKLIPMCDPPERERKIVSPMPREPDRVTTVYDTDNHAKIRHSMLRIGTLNSPCRKHSSPSSDKRVIFRLLPRRCLPCRHRT